MAKDNNVRDFFEDLAGTIRNKLGKAIKDENGDFIPFSPIEIQGVISEKIDSEGFGRFSKEVTCAHSKGINSISRLIVYRGVEEIGANAYNNLTEITGVELPPSLKKIGESAFSGCTSIHEIVIPEGVTYIDKNAFYNCEGLSTIEVLSNNRISFYGDPFNGTAWKKSCKEEVYLGKNLYTYGGTMPQGHTLKIKDGTLSIHDSACKNQTNLASIEFPKNNIHVGMHSFSYCTGLTNLLFYGEADIDREAFYECSNLETVEFDRLKSIGISSFHGCRKLKKITIKQRFEDNESLPTLSVGSFEGCPLENIYVPREMLSKWQNASSVWKNYKDLFTAIE